MPHSLPPQFVVVFLAQETMQPEYVSLWLKATADRRQPTTEVGGRQYVEEH